MPRIVAVVCADELAPRLSDTVTATVNTPTSEYACEIDSPVFADPSPSVQDALSGSASASVDPAALIAIIWPTSPEYGPSVTAVGAVFPRYAKHGPIPWSG